MIKDDSMHSLVQFLSSSWRHLTSPTTTATISLHCSQEDNFTHLATFIQVKTLRYKPTDSLQLSYLETM
jgi:hypothetical protein